MTNMEQINQYIEENIELIDANEWEEFFKDAPSGIGGVLYAARIDFMSDIKQIPEDCFRDSSLTNITIPNNVMRIGSCAFLGCSSLESITIPDSVTSIGNDAFEKCSSLKSITIPKRVTSIGSWVFADCSSLTSIIIPDSVTSIDSSAFKYCSSLESITIPDSVTSIGFSAFYDCSSLKSINFGGTKEQWKKIYDSDSFKYTYFTVHCTDGDIIKRKR